MERPSKIHLGLVDSVAVQELKLLSYQNNRNDHGACLLE